MKSLHNKVEGVEQTPAEEALDRVRVLREHAEFIMIRRKGLLNRKHVKGVSKRARKAHNAALVVKEYDTQISFLENHIRKEK
jgi:hypothetical protein